MLMDALRDNPGQQIVVKMHPDVVSGKKQGHLLKLAKQTGCHIVSHLVSSWSLLETCSKVYTVTSLTGFEALMIGKAVHCLWYAVLCWMGYNKRPTGMHTP